MTNNASRLTLAFSAALLLACGGSSSSGSALESSGGSSAPAPGSSSPSGSTPSSPTSTGGTPGSPGSPNGQPSACLAQPLLQAAGKQRVMLGAMMDDQVAVAAPFDLRYLYLAGGLSDGTDVCSSCGSCSTDWWGCWQDASVPPGQYVRDFFQRALADHQIPMITYYELLQASGASEGSGEVRATEQVSLMQRYFNDWRFLLQNVGDQQVYLHVEPDFWGYAEQLSSDPHALPAAVASANPTDCADQENSVAGMGKCLIAMARKYAPNAKVGLHASGWSTNVDVLLNRDGGVDVAVEARKTAQFLAACGEDQADFVAVDPSDRDAGYYASLGKDVWWDATNQTLPNFHQAFAWAGALTEALQKPALWWQVPVGNTSLPNQPQAWKDNRVDYLLSHPDELAASHAFAMVFGAGASDQTSPSTDSGHFVQASQAYLASGGAPACP